MRRVLFVVDVKVQFLANFFSSSFFFFSAIVCLLFFLTPAKTRQGYIKMLIRAV